MTTSSPEHTQNTGERNPVLPLPAKKLGFLFQITLLAIAYYGASLITQWKPLITDYASVVWPPSGVALAGLLIFGRSRWIGVWIGAFFTNVFHLAEISGESWLAFGPITQSFFITGGSVLEALLGAYLIQRMAGPGHWFTSGGSLIKLFLLGGPLACMVAAIIGPLTLMVGGIIDSDAVTFTMFTWWVGDSIGVLAVTPIILIWSPILGSQKSTWRWGIGGGLVLVLGLVTFFLGYVNDSNKKRADAAIHEHTVLLTKDIEARFDIAEDLLHAIATYIRLTTNISRDSFENFVQPMLDRHPGIQALEWIPVISASDRQRFENKSRNWYKDFLLNERTPEKLIVPADVRPYYFPVALVAPVSGNEKAVGFDLGSNPLRLAAIEKARDSGDATATPAITLVQEHGKQKAVLIFLPVYRTSAAPANPQERRALLAGFVLGVFRIGDWLDSLFARWTGPKLPLVIVDSDEQAAGEVIYQSTNAPETSNRDVVGEVRVADRVWKIRYFAREALELRAASMTAWVTIIGGLLFTVLLEAIALLVISRDNTTRRLVEQRTAELSASENRLRTILDTVLDGIITINDGGEITSANPAAERLFGWKFDEIVSKNVKVLMPDPYRAEHDGYINAYKSTGDRKIIGNVREVFGLRKDGSKFPMELAVSEMYLDGTRFFTGVVRDISERKRLDRLKSEFVSTVSHELRTPLTSIRGAMNLILKNPSEQVPDKIRSLLEIAERNSERLTLLINDLLDLEKIESNRLEFEFQACDLVELARRSVQDNEGYASKHDVILICKASIEKAVVRGDAHRIGQVFANLISNAIKFSSKQGKVEVTVGALDNLYRVTVRDYGAGIPESFRSRIFQRFAQADSSDSREKGGTGLGLSIVKAIVEHHKGKIDYDSTIGEGTTFFFDLPAL